MAGRKALLIAAAAMATVAMGALLPATTLADTYDVGGDSGWNRDVDYDDWASNFNFRVNDTLKFVYSKGLHNVVAVDQRSYEMCSVPDEPWMMDSGDDSVVLGYAGQAFFISGIGVDCVSGMKFSITIN